MNDPLKSFLTASRAFVGAMSFELLVQVFGASLFFLVGAFIIGKYVVPSVIFFLLIAGLLVCAVIVKWRHTDDE